MMRVFCFLFLLAFAGAVGLFAYQNQHDVTLTFWDRELTASLPLFVGAIYLAGMLSGWTVIGLLRRSVDRVTQPPAGQQGYASYR